MKLVIHDLKKEEWEKIARDYPDAEVVTDNGKMKPCVGCFGCWNKTPGECVIKDGYDNMGYLIHHADEVIVISRYTYGGFSGSVKNVFDRCLAYVLPQFEIVKGESHHQKRYDEIKPFTFIFYGHDISEEEKKNAERYVNAVCTNMRSTVKEVIFWQREEEIVCKTKDSCSDNDKVVLLNASMRSKNGNSAKLAGELKKHITKETEIINLSKYLSNMSELVRELEDVSTIVLCEPLYVDGLPSQLIRLLEKFRSEYEGGRKKIYVLANMGLYESKQMINLFSAIKRWCGKMNFDYCGGLGVGAGELVGGITEAVRFGKWPTRKIGEGINRLAEAVNTNSKTEDIYAGVNGFPRSLYIAIANSGWKRMAKKNGITEKDLYRQV